MSANSGSGGVRNLRAMFENKAGDQSTSPPSRGRSPNPSEISNGSRPVSKVRASFVAVERPGENGGPPILGLRRASEVSSLGGIQEHAIGDGGHLEKISTIRTDLDMKPDARPQPGRAPSSTNGIVESGLGKILKGSSFAESGTPTKTPKVAPVTSNAKNLGEALSSGKLQPKSPRSPSKQTDSTKAAALIKNMKSADVSKPGIPPTTSLLTTKTAQPVKAPPSRIAVKPHPKSPTVSKPPPKIPTSPVASVKGGPAKIRGVIDSAKQAQQATPEKLTATKRERAPPAPKLDTQTKGKASIDATKKDRTPTSPKATRSPKVTRPKSPTRPVKLPAAATANTASSAAKDAHHSPTEPEFRKSVSKKPSLLSMRQPRASISSTTSTIAKKTSRASLAMNGHDRNERPKSRVSTTAAKPDEGFLARMMRPTTSSAQKTHDKVQVHTYSPPRPRTSTSHRTKDVIAKKAPHKTHLAVPGEVDGRREMGEDRHEEGTKQEEIFRAPTPQESEEPANPGAAIGDEEGVLPKEKVEEIPPVEAVGANSVQSLPDAVPEETTVEAKKSETLVQPSTDDQHLLASQEEPSNLSTKVEVPTATPAEDDAKVVAGQQDLSSEQVNGGSETVLGNAVEV